VHAIFRQAKLFLVLEKLKSFLCEKIIFFAHKHVMSEMGNGKLGKVYLFDWTANNYCQRS
jgi:hypothetical protein